MLLHEKGLAFCQAVKTAEASVSTLKGRVARVKAKAASEGAVLAAETMAAGEQVLSHKPEKPED